MDAPGSESDPTPVALTIAGSDSGGGAGVQADLKAFAAAGVHGASAITALTAQSTVAVERVEAVSPEMIVAQVAAVAGDLRPSVVKIGMLGSRATVDAVAEALDLLPSGTPVVHDPVMVAESGGRLLDEDALDALVQRIVSRATVITPNLPEARALAGDDSLDGEPLLDALHALGAEWVLVTGGHRDEAVDLLRAPDGAVERIEGPRHPDGAAHGSGCTHASTLAAYLARGLEVPQAARAARGAAARAVEQGLRDVGAGAGPVDVLGLAARRAADQGGRPRRG